MRQDGIAELTERQDGVAELTGKPAGIQVSLNVTGSGGVYCSQCQERLDTESVRLLVCPPTEVIQEEHSLAEVRTVVLICRRCDTPAVTFETRLHFS